MELYVTSSWRGFRTSSIWISKFVGRITSYVRLFIFVARPRFTRMMLINIWPRVERCARPPHPAYNAYKSSWILIEVQFRIESRSVDVFCPIFSHLSPPPPLVPETGEGRDNVIRPDCRFQQCWVNPFGWATIDTCAVSGKHRSAIIGERWSTSSMTASWGLVPPGTGGTGLIATFMAPRGRLMRGRWHRSKLSSLPSFRPPQTEDLTNASQSLGRNDGWNLEKEAEKIF